VVAPQIPADQRWVDVPPSLSAYTLAPEPSAALAGAMGIVRELLRTYPQIDGDRIYVTGISMGGFGAWEAAERWPEMFAAALPIAGAGDPTAAGVLARVPTWAFHGALDDIVPAEGSRIMVRAARAAGGTACYTEYPDAGHDIWNAEKPYGDPRVLAWLFAQTKAPPGGVPPPPCPD